MTKKKDITGKNRGKHIGHACEGHLRGLLSRLPDLNGATVEKTFPFDFHVKPDAVVLERSGRISAVIIVAFWENADNSHMKYHRTRPEYFELAKMTASNPELFAVNPSVITVLYGSEDGWKPLILREIATKCRPLVFVPDFERGSVEKIWSQAFSQYRVHWENGVRDPTGKLEQWASEKTLTKSERRFLRALKEAMAIPIVAPSITDPRVQLNEKHLPSKPYRSRYRQPIAMLSMFKDSEISAYLENQLPDESIDIGSFIRRAAWLDMGAPFLRVRANGQSIVTFRLHEALDEKGQYAPHLPDYSSWRTGSRAVVSNILTKHRNRTMNPGRVFRGGASDQICGNYEGICASLERSMPAVVKSISDNSFDSFVRAIESDSGVSTLSWHPANGKDVILPVWSFCACAAATIKGERKLRSSLKARANKIPDGEILHRCFSILRSSANGVTLLEEMLVFSRIIRIGTIADLSDAVKSRPSLISLSNSCGWLADYYNTIATNSSHNPLNNLLEDWLAFKYPGFVWGKSWPNNRSTSLASIGGADDERRQWAFVGTKQNRVVCAECKSITGNHWGDKSKELYDKVNGFRSFCNETGRKGISILLFDGDLSQGALDELRTGIGHDFVVTCDEAIRELAAANLGVGSK